MSSGIDCGKLEEVLESIFQIPVDAARLDKWVNGGEFETVVLGGREVPTLRNLVRQIDERSSQAAAEEINEAKAEIGALAEKLKAKIDELKAMTASAETLPPDHPATVYYNAGTGEFEFGIPQGKQGIQGERGLAPAVDIIYGGDPADEALSIIYGGNPALNEPGDRTIVRQVARIGTSAQWATANPVLEDGESGYERTPEDKLLWKTGDGVTHWNDLPYPSILVDRIYRYRGSVATVEDLPADAAEGDVYNITSTGANYAWTGTQWDNLGVVQEIDPAPVRDSGNPVASGGVYAVLEDMRTDIAATGAPDEVTIVKDESGKLVAQDIAIGGDPADLASARGTTTARIEWKEKPDWNAVLNGGTSLRHLLAPDSVNGPDPNQRIACSVLTTYSDDSTESGANTGGMIRRRAQLAMQDSAGSSVYARAWLRNKTGERIDGELSDGDERISPWNEFLTAGRVGDGIQVQSGIPSVPEYEGATATEPGTAGLVPPATVEEKDKYLKGDGTYGSGVAASVFTPPTASAAGTEGLVPAPEATPLQVQPLRVMGPNAEWNVLRQGSFDVSWDEANSKKIVLGAKYVQAGTSVDAIPYAGDFYCDAWNVPGISEALTGVLIRRDPGTYGMEEESVRSSFEILYDLSFDAIRFRKTTGGFAAGGAYTWSDWDTLLEKSSAAPVPTASDGVGQWIALQATSSGFAALPQGGTWACYFSGNGPLPNAAKAGGVVILPGGSTPSFGTYQWGSYNDVAPEAVLAWRIA